MVVYYSHPGPDTDRVTDTETTGTNGASVATFVGTRAPESNITGGPGDFYRRDAGASGGALYLKSTGVATSTGWVVVPTPAVPLSVTATGTVGLGAETVVATGNITLPLGTTGRIFVSFGCNVGLSTPVLLSSNGASVRLRVAGVDVTHSTRTIQQSSAIAVSLTADSQEMSTSGIATGLAAGSVLVEVLAVKTGTTGTANLVGQRRLDAFQI